MSEFPADNEVPGGSLPGEVVTMSRRTDRGPLLSSLVMVAFATMASVLVVFIGISALTNEAPTTGPRGTENYVPPSVSVVNGQTPKPATTPPSTAPAQGGSRTTSPATDPTQPGTVSPAPTTPPQPKPTAAKPSPSPSPTASRQPSPSPSPKPSATPSPSPSPSCNRNSRQCRGRSAASQPPPSSAPGPNGSFGGRSKVRLVGR